MTTPSIDNGTAAAKLLNDHGYTARPSLGSKASFMLHWPKAEDSSANRAILDEVEDLLEQLNIDAELAGLSHDATLTTARYRIQGN